VHPGAAAGQAVLHVPKDPAVLLRAVTLENCVHKDGGSGVLNAVFFLDRRRRTDSSVKRAAQDGKAGSRRQSLNKD
jgi:hypothetical protein